MLIPTAGLNDSPDCLYRFLDYEDGTWAYLGRKAGQAYGARGFATAQAAMDAAAAELAAITAP
jgi:hypothetical protein